MYRQCLKELSIKQNHRRVMGKLLVVLAIVQPYDRLNNYFMIIQAAM